MGTLDFPPQNLTGYANFINNRLVVDLFWQPGAYNSSTFAILEYCTGSACSGFTEFDRAPVESYVYAFASSTYRDGILRTLTPSTIYRYRIRNNIGSDYSSYSNIFEITLPSFTPDPVPDPGTDTAPPLAPTSLATGGSANTINLDWVDNANNEDGFVLERYQVDPNSIELTFNWQIISTLPADTISYNDTGLEYSTLYYYRIKAFNTYGQSPYSNIVSRQTDALTVAGLTAPVLVSATAEFNFTAPQVVLIWTDNATTETAYLIERRASIETTFRLIHVTSPNVITFTDTNVVTGGQYNYRVRAYRSSDTQYSPYSNVLTVGIGSIFGEGESRVFSGSTSNYLIISGQGLSGSVSGQCAWISKDELGTLGTIFGNRFDAGYAFQINAADELQFSFQESGTIYYMSAPLTIAGGASQDYLQVNVPLFVACNITHSLGGSPPVTADFYAGRTPDLVSLIGSDSAGTFVASNGVQSVHIGGNNFGAGAPPSPTFDSFKGKLDRVGSWTRTLTLAEYRAVAVCNAAPSQTSLSFFLDMTGVSPEPNSKTAGTSATIVGTVPVSFGLCSGTTDGGPDVGDPTPAFGYGIAHDDPSGAATNPSIGGVIRDNQMSNNAIANMSPNVYTLQKVTIDNPGTENTYIRRGVIIYN